MEGEDKITIEVLNILFKILQNHKFENSIPEDIIEIIKEYIDSKRINVQLREIKIPNKQKHFEIGWDQDNLLKDLLSLSLKLYEPHKKDFERIHIGTKNKWFLDNMKFEGINTELEIITEIVLNQEKNLPGFEYFYEFNNEGGNHHSGNLLFVSEVGILAIIGVNNKFNYIENKKFIKNQIREYKTFANNRFGNKFVTIIGLYASYNRNGKITLNPVDSFDKMIMKKVKEFTKEKQEMLQEKTSNKDSDSSYSDSDSKEEESDSDDDVVIDDNSSQNSFFDFLKS
ncbi:10171_t:CDS:2, partial [Rhizophagus irregularis]